MWEFQGSNIAYSWGAVSPEGYIAGSFRPGHISPLGYLTTYTTYFRLQLFGEAVGFSLIFELRLPLQHYV